MATPTIDQWKSQADALRAQAAALSSTNPSAAAALIAQADGIDRAIASAAATVGNRSQKDLLGEAAAVLNQAAWAAIMSATEAVGQAGALSPAEKAAIAYSLLNPLVMFVASSPAEEKVARLLGARGALRKAYELLGQKWRANPTFRSTLASELPTASADLERAWGALVEWEGRVNDALHTVRDAPVAVAERMMRSYFSGLAGQLDKAGSTVDSLLEALKKLAELVKKTADTAAGAPGWILGLGLALGIGALVYSKTR